MENIDDEKVIGVLLNPIFLFCFQILRMRIDLFLFVMPEINENIFALKDPYCSRILYV